MDDGGWVAKVIESMPGELTGPVAFVFMVALGLLMFAKFGLDVLDRARRNGPTAHAIQELCEELRAHDKQEREHWDKMLEIMTNNSIRLADNHDRLRRMERDRETHR